MGFTRILHRTKPDILYDEVRPCVPGHVFQLLQLFEGENDD